MRLGKSLVKKIVNDVIAGALRDVFPSLDVKMEYSGNQRKKEKLI